MNLEEMGQLCGANGMDAEQANAVAERVKLHLCRGSIETARAALEDAWRDHVEQISELPTGRKLLDQPLSRVIDNMRTLNMLEEAGILTVEQLLRQSPGDLLSIPSLGQVTVNYLRNLCVGLMNRAYVRQPTS